MNKKFIIISIIILFILVISDTKTTTNTGIDHVEQEQQNLKQKATFKRVVDGDTIIVTLDGEQERVRLIGIDTPESVKHNYFVECFGREASDFLKKRLENISELYLEFDDVAGRYDKNGRLLAYLFLTDGTDINHEIIRQGYGHEYTYQGQAYKYKTKYKQAEKYARDNTLGLWSSLNCKG